MRKLPVSIKVGAHIFKVSQVYFKHRDGVRNKKDLLGEVDFQRNLIRIERSLNISHKFEVLLHEIVHAFDYIYQMKLKESEVEKWGQLFTAFLVDNVFLDLQQTSNHWESAKIAAKRNPNAKTK